MKVEAACISECKTEIADTCEHLYTENSGENCTRER